MEHLLRRRWASAWPGLYSVPRAHAASGYGIKQARMFQRPRAAQQLLVETEGIFTGEDFYAILGVAPNSDIKDIKKAYYSMMRECHPDKSQDEDATEFCILLNEIYQTLADPEKRAAYDELAGFSAASINPFLDTAFTADQVFVDEFTCIGCRNCTNVCPSTFAIEEEYGRARAMRQGADGEELLQEAIDTCPVNCIHWVTSPQLSLLEAAMAKMERVAVWSLMSGGGGGKDVFTEASMAWEKRQAGIRARVEEARASSIFQGFGWSVPVEGSYAANFTGKAASSQGASNSREAGGVAKLAARAARASRLWKRYQDQQRSSKEVAGLVAATVARESGRR